MRFKMARGSLWVKIFGIVWKEIDLCVIVVFFEFELVDSIRFNFLFSLNELYNTRRALRICK